MKLRDCVAHRLNYDEPAAERVCADRYREHRAGTRISASLYIELHTSPPCRLTGHRDTTRASRAHYALALRPAFLPGRGPLPFDRCVTVYKLQNNAVKGNQTTGFCPRKMHAHLSASFVAFLPFPARNGLLASPALYIYDTSLNIICYLSDGSMIPSGTTLNSFYLSNFLWLLSFLTWLIFFRCVSDR